MPTNFVQIWQAVSSVWGIQFGNSYYDRLDTWLYVAVVLFFSLRVVDDLLHG